MSTEHSHTEDDNATNMMCSHETFTSETEFLKNEVDRMKKTIDEMRKEQFISMEKMKKEQALANEELRSLVLGTNALQNRQSSNLFATTRDTIVGRGGRMHILGRTQSLLVASGKEIYLDEDTYSLMMISQVGSPSWILGFVSSYSCD